MRRSLFILFTLFAAIGCQESAGQSQGSFEIKRLSFNTSVFNEISPVIVRNGLLFCSDRRFSGITDRTSYDGRRLFNVFFSGRKDTLEWGRPVEIVNERSELFNNGPLTVSPDGRTVYFTSEIETGEKAKSRKFRNRSGIFIADLAGQEMKSIRPFRYNDPAYDVAQPSVSSDGRYLLFASDMPGGEGGSDIYYCENINGEWGSPVNAGPHINSPGRENYPYLHTDGRLYFSSDRPGGRGGLDIYYSTGSPGSWDNPVRLPEPVNSSSDDFAFVAMPDLETGYFASNRRRSDDIYEFVNTVIRRASCDALQENNYCYELEEANALKYDSIPFRYQWKFGDGDTAIGRTVQHCFRGPGTYIVQLDVVNLITGEITVNEKSEELVIQDIEQPYITSADTARVNAEINFSGAATNLPGWEISKYYWNFGDETIAIGEKAGKTFMNPGTYNVQLIITAKPGPDGAVREACVSKNIIIQP